MSPVITLASAAIATGTPGINNDALQEKVYTTVVGTQTCEDSLSKSATVTVV